MDKSELERFFGSLNAGLEEADASAQQELERFFFELAPRWETAQILERELDRELARKFNAFDYLRTDEQGLSKVIASLLNPKGAHGQGDFFLRLLLDKLEFNKDNDLKNINVRTEHGIKDSRRLDIRLEMGNVCLAIENKPYAADQQTQVKDYLGWLRKKYDDFRLIYLSPNGKPPSNESVTLACLKKNYAETFCVMPYYKVEGDWEDGFDRFRTSFGLTDWLKKCRKECDVDRLRWFLREAETFCERQFGGNTMTDREIETVKEFVLREHRNVETAATIYGAWDSIKEEIVGQFIEALSARIQKELPDLTVGYNYGPGRYDCLVNVYRPEWQGHWIDIITDAKGPNYWLVGIVAPSKDQLNQEQKKRRESLEETLRQTLGDARVNDHRPWWKYVDQFQDWRPLITALHAELQEKDGEAVGGKITDYFVETLTEVATTAVPILDEIAGT